MGKALCHYHNSLITRAFSSFQSKLQASVFFTHHDVLSVCHKMLLNFTEAHVQRLFCLQLIILFPFATLQVFFIDVHVVKVLPDLLVLLDRKVSRETAVIAVLREPWENQVR